ncbi:MAG TPA: winged helix-turn-helix transcriptional regulator [Rhodospirillales bacterium]|nr:winged helix-turn-helix transcriptional regulator [Rhodospirillales bacterium]
MSAPRSRRPSARPPAVANDRRGQVQSLQRAIRILEVLAESAYGMSLGEMAEILGLPPSTLHRLLTTLEAARFVRFDAAEGLWQIGVQAFIVGSAFVRARDLVRTARPHMRRLMEASGETANIYVEEEGEAVCIGQVECRQMMRAIARPGGRVRMHCSGAGKALLAWRSDEELAAILRRHGLPRATEHTIDRPARLREELARIRARGFAVDDEEHAIGLRCVAAPVFDEQGYAIAALSISGPRARIDDARLAELGALVARAAEAVTAAYGGRHPDRDGRF